MVGVALTILGVALLWVSVGRAASPVPVPAEVKVDDLPSSAPSSSAPPSSSAAPSPTARATPVDVRDRVTGTVLPESDPVRVSIPGIGVESGLVDLGIDGSGALEVPRDPSAAGWFSGGAAPGALGPAVIAGHVTWNGVPSVFYRLATLRTGDRILVDRKDGRTAVFTVTRVETFSKSRFPTQAVYGEVDHAALRLITCGGTYDQARHRYLDNVVVFARLSDVRDQHR